MTSGAQPGGATLEPMRMLIYAPQPLLARLLAESLAARGYHTQVETDLTALAAADERLPAGALLVTSSDAAHVWLSAQPPVLRRKCLVLGDGDLDRFADLDCRLVSPADSLERIETELRHLTPAESEPRQKLLIVDDDPDTRATIREYFQALGYDCRSAANGAEALARIREETPQVILLDLNMPELGGLDFLKTDPDVNGNEVGIEGVSRWGKAALITMAFDKRFRMVLVGSSGKGGATPLRRHFGEEVASLASSGEFHWMAGNFLKYAATKASFGSMNPGDIPVDSNELIAMCAPRLVFISYGIPAKGDAKWLDQRGSWMATVDASKVWKLLGAKGLSPAPTQNYHTAPMPPVNHGLLDGKLAWRQDDGGHTDAPNMIFFIHWVDKWTGYKRQSR